MKRRFPFVLALSIGALALPVLTGSSAQASTTLSTPPSTPQCIVSLSPTATDTLYTIGAGAQVQAVDEYSDYPARAKALSQKHKINALSPSLEGILGICRVTKSYPTTKPDLVLISYDPSDFQSQLAAAGIKVVDLAAATSIADAYNQIEELGRLTGHRSRADALVSSMKKTITADIASVPAHPKKKISVYYEITANPYYSLTSGTFVGSLLKSLGLVNIANPASTTADAGYPELNDEYIIHADPDLIFLAGDASPASVAKRVGWGKLNAVSEGNVVELNADVASQWGPRLTTLVGDLSTEVKHVIDEHSS